MKIAVSGASGFIGRTLCTALAAAGHEPQPLVLREAADASSLAGAGAVVHLAAIAHRRGVGRDTLRRVNVDLAAAVGSAAAASGARMIFMSSVKVHGERSAQPIREDAPLLPQDAYAESKARAEEALRGTPALRLTVLRPPLVYGSAVRANFLRLMRALARGVPLPLASIANRRSLVYVGNIANAVIECLANPQSVGRTYLASDGAAVSTPELCRRLAGALGCQARLFPFPTALLGLAAPARSLIDSLEVDDGAIRRELGWKPPFSFEEGLRLTAAWYRNR